MVPLQSGVGEAGGSTFGPAGRRNGFSSVRCSHPLARIRRLNLPSNSCARFLRLLRIQVGGKPLGREVDDKMVLGQGGPQSRVTGSGAACDSVTSTWPPVHMNF